MPLLHSILYSLKESRGNPATIIHATLYAATVTYLRVLKHVARLAPARFRNGISETYHSKVVRLEDARRIITVNRDIELRNLEQVLPYRHAKDLVLKNPSNIAVYQCPCRSQKPDPCQPTEVCLIVGDPFVDLLRMFQPFRTRRITQEEALEILRAEDERGHIHTAWFKQAMLDRFYAICNCCKCCCLGMKFMAAYRVKMLQPSGYRSVIGAGCTGCGVCVPYCQFGAIKTVRTGDNGTGGGYRVSRKRCFGCGVCESKCSQGAITLVLDPEKGVPLNIEALEHGRTG